MSSPKKPDPRVAGNVVLDSLLTLAAFVFFFFVTRSHVSSDDPTTINIIGCFSAASLAGTFWFAWQMFRVVWRGQREDEKNGE